MIAIVGGGAIGLVCAWRLAQAGARVTVFERGALGGEASWAAGGMLAPTPEFWLHSSRDEGAVAMLQLSRESRDLYADFAAELLELTGVDIELCLRNSPTADWREAGILMVAPLAENGDDGRDWNGRAARWFADEGQVEPRKLVEALRAACERVGVCIRENTPVRGFHIEDERIKQLWLDDGNLEVEQVVLCAGAWSGQGFGLPVEAVPPIRPVAGQMLQLRAGRALKHIVYGEDCYLIPRRDGRLLIGATVEEVGFERRVTARGIAQLLDAALQLAPVLNDIPLETSWAGLRPTSPDGLPILGTGPIENLSYATGHGRNGILLAPRTAQLMVGHLLRDAARPEAFGLERFSPLVETQIYRV